jgi:hypothetical protein
MDSQHEIQPLASKLISEPLMSKYSTSCAAALTAKIRFPETSEVPAGEASEDETVKSGVDVIKDQLASCKRDFAKHAAYKMLIDTQTRSPTHAHEKFPLAFWKHNGVSLSKQPRS